MNLDQIIAQRQALVEELLDVVEKHRTDVGCGMVVTDVIGAIETVKLIYFTKQFKVDHSG